jgi:hypothetical protein
VTGTAADDAAALVAEVRDHPARRLELALRFYDRQVGERSIRSYGRAVAAFMRWQIARGVLAAPTDDQPGSPWWRAVNEGLLRDTWEAASLVAGRPGPVSRPSVVQWVRFLRQPSSPEWYRAHNASIVAGYLDHRDLAQQEHPLERFFMDVALVRVLFAHALLAAPRLAVRHGRAIAPVLADPRWRGADLFLSLRNVLPDRYPLTELTVDQLIAEENYISRIIDYGLILPSTVDVYAYAAAVLDEPRVLDLVHDNVPAYAWPYEDRSAWRTARSPLARRLVTFLVGGGGKSAGHRVDARADGEKASWERPSDQARRRPLWPLS